MLLLFFKEFREARGGVRKSKFTGNPPGTVNAGPTVINTCVLKDVVIYFGDVVTKPLLSRSRRTRAIAGHRWLTEGREEGDAAKTLILLHTKCVHHRLQPTREGDSRQLSGSMQHRGTKYN